MKLHKLAKTTSATRAYIQNSSQSGPALVRELGISVQLGDSGATGAGVAPTVAEGGDRALWRQRLLPLEDVALVRALRGEVSGGNHSQPQTPGVGGPLDQTGRRSLRSHGRQKQRRFALLHYGARSWGRKRRVIVKAKYGAHGATPRFVVTNLQEHSPCMTNCNVCAGRWKTGSRINS